MRTITPDLGKFEGNRSQMIARAVHNTVGNGGASCELGDVQDFGYYALVTGKRYTYILEENDQGFVHVAIFSHSEGLEKWEQIEQAYETLWAETNPEDMP